MIKATLYHNKNGDVYGFNVQYHGEAIVCAGVSALVITCVNFIQANFALETSLDVKDAEHISFKISALKAGQRNHDASLIIKNMVFGLRQIEEAYPDNICIYTKSTLK